MYIFFCTNYLSYMINQKRFRWICKKRPIHLTENRKKIITKKTGHLQKAVLSHGGWDYGGSAAAHGSF